MIYEYECEEGHITEYSCSYKDRPKEVRCVVCGYASMSIISSPFVANIFGNGRSIGTDVAHDGREFKDFRELDSYLDKRGDVVNNISKAQLKTKQEERLHGRGNTQKKKPVKGVNIPKRIASKLESFRNDSENRTNDALGYLKREFEKEGGNRV